MWQWFSFRIVRASLWIGGSSTPRRTKLHWYSFFLFFFVCVVHEGTKICIRFQFFMSLCFQHPICVPLTNYTPHSSFFFSICCDFKSDSPSKSVFGLKIFGSNSEKLFKSPNVDTFIQRYTLVGYSKIFQIIRKLKSWILPELWLHEFGKKSNFILPLLAGWQEKFLTFLLHHVAA